MTNNNETPQSSQSPEFSESPHATPQRIDPSTPEAPELELSEPPAPTRSKGDDPTAAHSTVKSSLAGGTWVALIVGTILLILLLVFILQNQEPVNLQLFAFKWSVPAGVSMLIAAITGALIMAIVGGVRIAQLRRQVKRSYK